jgi:hypothetical protein
MPEEVMSKSEGMPEVFLKSHISDPWHPLVYHTLDTDSHCRSGVPDRCSLAV